MSNRPYQTALPDRNYKNFIIFLHLLPEVRINDERKEGRVLDEFNDGAH